MIKKSCFSFLRFVMWFIYFCTEENQLIPYNFFK